MKELTCVVPFVQRPGIVETLVTLQADQSASRRCGQRFGEFGLADAGRTFQQQRSAEHGSEMNHHREVVVDDITVAAQRLCQSFRAAE